jgi:hypothetical protein
MTCDEGVKNQPAEELGVNFVVFHVMYYGDATNTEISEIELFNQIADLFWTISPSVLSRYETRSFQFTLCLTTFAAFALVLYE